MLAGLGDALPVSAFRRTAPPVGTTQWKSATSPKRSRSGSPTCAPSATTASPPARTPPFAPRWFSRRRWSTPPPPCSHWMSKRAICAARNTCCR
ncbi:hypothetical protein M8494_09305 [Serratia ureilytica]